MPWKPPGPSALDDMEWPTQLVARAIEPDATDDHLHGYAALGDLAQRVSFADTIYLALTGELPDTRSAALFGLALFSFATPSVGEAPTHLAIVTRLTGSPFASALGAALATASDAARHLMTTHSELLRWLDAPIDALPDVARGATDPWVAALIERVTSIDATVDGLRAEMTKDAARIALLHAAGMRAPEQMIATIVAASVAGIAAETLATGPQHLGIYPINVPKFEYVDDEE
jgi:hypothetical protein